MVAASLLVVDDDEEIRGLLKDYFQGIGYVVATAEGGHEALQKLNSVKVDCIISDFVMPEMDGLELLRRMRAENMNMPFLMNTGHPSVDSAVEAMKAGAYDYISKPLELEDVRIKVERALYTKKLERSVKTVNGIIWAVLISIPLWLILGIVMGKVWK
ncbi:MAG: response regulator [Syntrophobacterales bacterium]|nr:response regulator [Syntrophobacterales bacterium]